MGGTHTRGLTLQSLPILKLNLRNPGICTMDVNERIHAQLVKAGVKPCGEPAGRLGQQLIRRMAKDNEIRHVPVGREAETIAICAGAFFGGVRSVAIIGNTGLLTCTGEMATLCLRHMIPVFCIVSGRGSIDDHKVYQEVQGRRTDPAAAGLRLSLQGHRQGPRRSRTSRTPTNGIACRSVPSSCSSPRDCSE